MLDETFVVPRVQACIIQAQGFGVVGPRPILIM